jgi:hypothetical protein
MMIFFYMISQTQIDPGLVYNRANAIIRLVNGRNVDVGQIIAFGRQFSTAKLVVRNRSAGAPFFKEQTAGFAVWYLLLVICYLLIVHY